MSDDESMYRETLGSVLRRRDPLMLQRFLVRQAEHYGNAAEAAEVGDRDEEEMVELLHRMILARPDLSDLHRESRAWLFTQGIDASGDSGTRN